jgi:hypothetical protein
MLMSDGEAGCGLCEDRAPLSEVVLSIAEVVMAGSRISSLQVSYTCNLLLVVLVLTTGLRSIVKACCVRRVVVIRAQVDFTSGHYYISKLDTRPVDKLAAETLTALASPAPGASGT